MRIKTITLYSNDIESQKTFYKDILGYKLHNESVEGFTISIGWSKLTFKKSIEKHHYHYCFLLPSNKLDEALDWFRSRLDMILIDEEYTFDFVDWNAKSFYFYDGNNNVAECIVRYDMNNTSTSKFELSDLLCVNEIGIPTTNIQRSNKILETSLSSHFWKGNFDRFVANGNNEGLFLLVNNDVKKVWFPTSVPTQSSPFEAKIKTKKGLYALTFSNQELKVI